MKYLTILAFIYALWRTYVNYKSDIKMGSEISLAVGAILAFITNTYYKDSLVAVVFQLGLAYLITRQMLRSNRKTD